MSCAHVREQLGAYALDALEPAEREAVAAHLATCPACAAEHARLAPLPALLAHAEGLEIPAAPPAVEERLLDRIARERGAGRRMRRPRRRRLLPAWAGARALAAGALAGAVLGAGVTALVLRDDAPAGSPASYSLVLNGDGGASARARLSPGRGGTELHLWVKGLPPGGDVVYEVRCERPGWSASAGTFRADARGRAYVVLTTAARLGEYERVRVVRRPDAADVLSGELN
ncbi:MAG TPA: anti-sigma factor [Solirubrobacteraceae bacterium]|nr:anti-sigma factor [Solirubrobacteraceae bacterium]